MRIFDLSYPIHDHMFRFQADYHPDVQVEQTGTYEKNLCVVHKLTLGTHAGTHVDAPAHFFPDGTTIDNVPLEMLVCEAVRVDLRPTLPLRQIEPEDVARAEVRPGDSVLLQTGWEDRWGTDFYVDPPALTLIACRQLLDAGAASLAVDFPLGLDIHREVLGRGKILIENLTGLHALTATRLRLIALPLKIRSGDGAPARVVAIEE